MRINRLALARYGHLSDLDLVFPPSPGMHIVLGANEAGKSTALAAIGDALFRFPLRTPYAFAHATRDLRLGIEVQGADGRIGRFVRRKGNRDDLTDEQGTPLPETAIAAFLAGASRERFQHLFGLDAAALRSGGQAILEGRGEVGESLLQAHTGLHGFRPLVDRLGEEASRLFGDRRGRRELHVAVDRFKEAKSALEKRTVEPSDYRTARETLAALEASRAALAGEADRLHTERARLDRIRRTAPARMAVARASAERDGIGAVSALPPDADDRRLAAITARERAAHELATIRSRDEVLAAALAALAIDAALLADAEVIDALAEDRSRIAATERDRAEQRIVAEQHHRALVEAAARLGVSPDAGDIAARIPGPLSRDTAERAILAHVRLSERRAHAVEADADARAQHATAVAAFAQLPAPMSSTALRAAIEAARAEGRIDVERDAAERAEADAAAERDRLLAALPLWSRDAEALAAARLPLDALVAERATALDRAQTLAQTAGQKLAAHDATLATLAADLRDLSAAGALPTPEAIAAARELRDRAWRLIRRHRLDGGPVPDATELAGLAPEPGLADRFERLIRDADALVDRGEAERTRLTTFATLTRAQEREQTARSAAAEAMVRADAAQATAQHEWQALWADAGISPLAPPAMREWRTRCDAVVRQRQRHAEALRHRLEVAIRHDAARVALAAQLPDEPGQSVRSLLTAAERLLATRDSGSRARAEGQAAVEAAVASMAKAARALARSDADLAEWAAAWGTATAALGLPAGTAPEAAKLALTLWNAVEAEHRAWQAATDRIAQMTQTIAAYMAEAVAVARRAAPDVSDRDMHEAVRSMAFRLAESRVAAAERDSITTERGRLHDAAALAAAHHLAAQTELATLHTLAGTQSDADLQAAIARAARHAALTADLAARTAELQRLDDGKSLAELEAEADGIDLDALPGRIAGIETRLREIADDASRDADRVAELRHAVAAMQAGRDAAGAAQDMEDSLADIADIGGRYVRARLAHTLLRAGIERFRRQQQGPLLSHAGALFARLTEGRYHALGVEEEDAGKPALVAERPDRTTCPADRLSEGTRDQLYLALRLAAIESYAATTEPLPFIADDLLVNFDDGRARAALRVLGEMGMRTQVILFTHHAHIVELADPALASLHRLGAPESVAA